MTDIAHLALGVRDPARSLAFYRDIVGLEGAVREADFGFADEEAVGTRRADLAAMGIPEVDWWVEPGFVSLKVTDPDGYVVEFFLEQAGEPMQPETDADALI